MISKATSSVFSGIGRQKAISQFFAQLEQRYGNIEQLKDEQVKRVIVRDKLDRESLENLFEHKAGAIHIPGFFSPREAARLAKRLLADKTRRNWSVSHRDRGEEQSTVDSAGGIPYNVALAEGRLDEYFDGALYQMRRLRKHTTLESNGAQPEETLDMESEVMSPIDKLRLELDEVWPHGATVNKNSEGKPHMAGLARISEPDDHHMGSSNQYMGGFMHVDDLGIMRSDKGLFSANIYLQQPVVGGELQYWAISIKSRWDFYRHASTLANLLVQDAHGQRLLRNSLPPPINIKPQPGDLVLLCVQRPHAVKGPMFGAPRVSMQTFLQHERGKPIKFEN